MHNQQKTEEEEENKANKGPVEQKNEKKKHKIQSIQNKRTKEKKNQQKQQCCNDRSVTKSSDSLSSSLTRQMDFCDLTDEEKAEISNCV